LRLVGGMAALVAVAVLSWALLVRNRQQSRTPDHQLRTASPAAAERQPPSENPASSAPDSQPTTVAVLNLEGLSRTRGMSDGRVRPELQSLPMNTRVALSIYLPLGSDEGQ